MEQVQPNPNLAWHDFFFKLPPMWETVGHSVDSTQGKMEFASPTGFEAQLSWRKVDSQPDLNRINDEVFRNQLKKSKSSPPTRFNQLKRQTIGQFNLGYEGEGFHFLASTYIQESKTLLEWVFPSYKASILNGIVSEMLKSFSVIRGKHKRWAAFGIDVLIPDTYNIAEAKVLPADVNLVFENKKFHRINARRWGMPAVLLEKQSLQDFYHRVLLSEKLAVDKIHQKTLFGSTGVEIEFRRRGQKGMDKLLGGWWKGIGFAWYKEDEKRIYALESVAPKKHHQVLSPSEVFNGDA